MCVEKIQNAHCTKKATMSELRQRQNRWTSSSMMGLDADLICQRNPNKHKQPQKRPKEITAKVVQ
jgi:hypothetical protein